MDKMVGYQATLWQNQFSYPQSGFSMKFCPLCTHQLQQVVIEDVTRMACLQPGCGFVHWNNPVPVVAALVRHEGNYILDRNAQWPEQCYSVITGYLEAGEAPDQAVVREVGEELGLVGHSLQQIGNYAFYDKNQVILAYHVQATGRIQINNELAAVISLTPAELNDYDFGSFMLTRRIIDDWRQSVEQATGFSL
ncbi:MAG: NUDIX domain-containing protein [Gammaproteobacteria bacterium]